MQRVVITGSRHTKNEKLILVKLHPYILLAKDRELRFLHGACETGADKLADEILKDFNLEPLVRTFPADWDRYGNRAGPIRNKEMIATCMPGDVALAFPHREKDSKGTWNCITEAFKKRLIIHIYPTDT